MIQENISNLVAKISAYTGGLGTWIVIAGAQLGMTYREQLMLLGAKAFFSIAVAFACGFAGKLGADLFYQIKNKKSKKDVG